MLLNLAFKLGRPADGDGTCSFSIKVDIFSSMIRLAHRLRVWAI